MPKVVLVFLLFTLIGGKEGPSQLARGCRVLCKDKPARELFSYFKYRKNILEKYRRISTHYKEENLTEGAKWQLANHDFSAVPTPTPIRSLV